MVSDAIDDVQSRCQSGPASDCDGKRFKATISFSTKVTYEAKSFHATAPSREMIPVTESSKHKKQQIQLKLKPAAKKCFPK
jgi:hypothetical protein